MNRLLTQERHWGDFRHLHSMRTFTAHTSGWKLWAILRFFASATVPFLNMLIDLTVPKSLMTPFARLRDLATLEAEKLLPALKNAKLTTVTDLEDALKTALDETKARDVSMALLNLVHLRRAYFATPEEICESVLTSMMRRPTDAWAAAEAERWRQLFPVLSELLKLDSLVVVEKVLDLRYNDDNFLGRARIITEARPIFGENIDDIRTFIVGHVLRLDYSHGRRSESISISLDDRDLELLKLECERAIEKNISLNRRFASLSLSIVSATEDEK